MLTFKTSSISPQTLDPHKKEATGAEPWSGLFVYPNGWHIRSHRRVLIKDPPQSLPAYIWIMIKNKPIYRSLLLFMCYMFIIIVTIYLLMVLLS